MSEKSKIHTLVVLWKNSEVLCAVSFHPPKHATTTNPWTWAVANTKDCNCVKLPGGLTHTAVQGHMRFFDHIIKCNDSLLDCSGCLGDCRSRYITEMLFRWSIEAALRVRWPGFWILLTGCNLPLTELWGTSTLKPFQRGYFWLLVSRLILGKSKAVEITFDGYKQKFLWWGLVCYWHKMLHNKEKILWTCFFPVEILRCH